MRIENYYSVWCCCCNCLVVIIAVAVCHVLFLLRFIYMCLIVFFLSSAFSISLFLCRLFFSLWYSVLNFVLNLSFVWDVGQRILALLEVRFCSGSFLFVFMTSSLPYSDILLLLFLSSRSSFIKIGCVYFEEKTICTLMDTGFRWICCFLLFQSQIEPHCWRWSDVHILHVCARIIECLWSFFSLDLKEFGISIATFCYFFFRQCNI